CDYRKAVKRGVRCDRRHSGRGKGRLLTRQSIMKEWQSAHIVWRPRMALKKEEARRAVLSEYDSWAKKYPNQAILMGGFLFFRYLQAESRIFSISGQLAASSKSFTAGFEIGRKISLSPEWPTD